MIWEIFDTYKDGSSIARQYQLFQDMKDLNIEILASNNQFRMENKQLKQQLHDIKDYLSTDIKENYFDPYLSLPGPKMTYKTTFTDVRANGAKKWPFSKTIFVLIFMF